MIKRKLAKELALAQDVGVASHIAPKWAGFRGHAGIHLPSGVRGDGEHSGLSKVSWARMPLRTRLQSEVPYPGSVVSNRASTRSHSRQSSQPNPKRDEQCLMKVPQCALLNKAGHPG
jgi:hypothetical protein